MTESQSGQNQGQCTRAGTLFHFHMAYDVMTYLFPPLCAFVLNCGMENFLCSRLSTLDCHLILQNFRKGQILAIAGANDENIAEVWIGRCTAKVSSEQHSFDLQWLERESSDSASWSHTKLTDTVFRNSVICEVDDASWQKSKKVYNIDAEEFDSFVKRLPEFSELARRDTPVDLHPPQTPLPLTTTVNASELLKFLLSTSAMIKEVS